MGSARTRAVVALAAVAALSIASVAPTAAAADDRAPGVGSSSGSASVLNVLLGADSLGLRLLSEESSTSNDPAAGGPVATEQVTPLQIVSSLVPGLAAAEQPAVGTTSKDGEQSASTPGVDLGTVLAGLPVPGLLSGTLDPIALRSLVDADGALSSATGAVRDLSVLGGLLSTGVASLDLGSSALVTDAGAIRGLELDRLEVLDLSALLDALGISLADLPLDIVVGLVDQLGLPLPAGLSPDALLASIDDLLADTGPVRTQVSGLQAQIDALQSELAGLPAQISAATATVTSLTSQLDAAVASLGGALCALVPDLCALISSLQGQLATATSLVATLEARLAAIPALIDGLIAQVNGLLDGIQGLVDQLLGLVDPLLDGLDGASLLVVEDLAVGLVATADDTLDASVAEVVGSVGDVRVGGISLGGLDATGALGQVGALADQLTGALGAILGTIDPSLASLVDVELLEQTTSVTEADGVTQAVAGITGLAATITPPDICGVLDRLAVGETLGSVLDGLGEALPSLPGPVGDVLGDLTSTVRCEAPASPAGSKALVDGLA
ncbi:MAG TPA: hypothetical protein VIR58_04650, partial [Acidimicrobiales bacterium]